MGAAKRERKPSSDLDDERWAAVCARDSAYDGRFVTAVHTTGIYCRPSCPARHPFRDNVTFFDKATLARAAGYRACKRCRPDDPDGNATNSARKIAAACALIDAADSPPALSELADAAGLSLYHFHRVFRALTGVTPAAYAAERRHRRLQSELPGAASVTHAAYASGFNSSGQFYAAAPASLGMAPSVYKAGGRGETIHYAVSGCTLGRVLMAATATGVCAILLGDEADLLTAELASRFPRATLVVGDPSFAARLAQVIAEIEGTRTGHALPLDIRGTAFQRRVWEELRRIPEGTTTTYAAIADRIGAPKAVRAVAGACAKNAIAVIIPCHRVVRTDGSLSGYRWGVERKRALLKKERGGNGN